VQFQRPETFILDLLVNYSDNTPFYNLAEEQSIAVLV